MGRKIFSLAFGIFFLAVLPMACSSGQIPQAVFLTPPAIGLEITGDVCPAIEVQAGMQIAWTNRDDSDHALWLERKDENGALVDAGGTDLLQPGTTFSITLTEPGQYTYYCTKDKSTSGTITVLP
jgi:hypothetical protein